MTESNSAAKGSPRVSIGLPVYNGERFLRQAVDSILAQTYRDWELVITDNASTDSTPAICREYAERDTRIHYYSNPQNIGLSANFARSFTLCRGEYFKWLAADDACSPEFLSNCVDALDRNRDAVLVYPAARKLEDDGSISESGFGIRDAWPSTPAERFRAIVDEFSGNNGATAGVYMYGLMRANPVKRSTRLIGDYLGADCVFVTELGLAGDLLGVRESHLYVRVGISAKWMKNWDLTGFLNWYNPSSKGRLSEFAFSHRRNLEYSRAALRSGLALPLRLKLATYALGVPLKRLRARLIG